MIRRMVKATVCESLARSGLDRLIGAALSRRGRPWVLGYHRVVEDERAEPAMPGLSISVSSLEAQIDWLARNFEITSLARVASAFAQGQRQRRPLAAITFDDGYRDNYDLAFPLFQRKGAPAAFFLITDAVETGKPPLHDRIYHGLHRTLQRRGEPDSETCAYVATRVLTRSVRSVDLEALCADLDTTPNGEPMTWDMARRMRDGGMEIGSHTASHRLLTRTSKEDVQWELVSSKAALERELGEPSRLFSYPDGEFDPDVVAAVAGAGYDAAVTTCQRRDALHPHLTLPRTMLSEGATTGVLGSFSAAMMRSHASGVSQLWRPDSRDHRFFARAVARWL